MSSDFMSKNIDTLAKYFKDGEHSYCTLGIEVEHFIVYSDNKEAVPYYGDFGINYVIRELSAFYPDAKFSSLDPLLGFSTDRFDITLEPAAQFEISIAPLDNISSIKKIYETFREYLQEVIEPFGYECVTIGYQPFSKVNDLKLIPKKRYEFMDRYFLTSGNRGRNMMRGTAATQVSIDYSDETDFRRKLQAAYFLSPYFKLLSENSPYFEGEKNEKPLLRSHIWDNVDAARCGIVPGAMNPDFGYHSYAAAIMNVPPIFIPENITGGDAEYTAEKAAYECIGDAPISDEWITHLLSMMFFDVRVKHYIEIRMADSMPTDSIFAYVCLIKGLLYSESFLDYTENFIKQENINAASIIETTKDLSEKGWEGTFYNVPVLEAHRNLLRTARDNLSDEEQNLLKKLNIHIS